MKNTDPTLDKLVRHLRTLPTANIMEDLEFYTSLIEVHWDDVQDALTLANQHGVRVVSENQEEAHLVSGSATLLLVSYAPGTDTLTMVANDLIELDSQLDGGIARLVTSGQSLPEHLRGDMTRSPIPRNADIAGPCDTDALAWQLVSRSIDAFWATPMGTTHTPTSPASEVLTSLLCDMEPGARTGTLNWHQIAQHVQTVTVDVNLIAGAKALAGPIPMRLPKTRGTPDSLGR